MGLARTIARRSLLQRPGRTLFSVLGIAVGIATVVAVRTLDHNTIEGMRLRHSPDWRPDLEVRPARELDDPRAALAGTEGVVGAAAFFQNEALLRPVGAPDAGRGGRGRSVRARLIAAEAGELPEMEAYALLAGEDLSRDAAEPEVLIGAAVAQGLGLSPGDSLEISRPPRAARKACIDGELREVGPSVRDVPVTVAFTVKGVLAREKLGRRSNGEVVLVDYDWGRKLYHDVRLDERYWVRPDPVVDLEKLQASLAGSFAYDIGRSVVVGRAADERAFRNGVLMAGLLAMVLGLYVIFHTLSMSLVERVREVGTLHALGTTRAQIARVFLLEASALSSLGGLLGLGLGVLFAWVLLQKGLTTLGSGHRIEYFAVPWGFVLPITFVGMALALAGSIFPLFRARGASTVEALRGQQALEGSEMARGFHLFAAILLAGILPGLYFVVSPVIGEATAMLIGATLMGVGVLALLVVVPLLVPRVVKPLFRLIARPLRWLMPFSGRMAAHTMLADPRRIAVSTAAVALVTAAFVGLKGMTASLSGEIEQWAGEAIADKVFVRGLPPVPFAALAEELRRQPEVLGVEPGSARAFSPFLMLGLRTDELSGYGPLRDEPRLRRELDQRHGMILSKRLARNLAYDVGDVVQVGTGSGVQEFRVVAISDAYGYFPRPDERMYGVVSDRYMKQYFCLDVETVDRIAVRLRPGSDPAVVTAVVQEFLGGEASVEVETGANLRDLQVEDIGQDFFLFDVILALTALLAAIGVLNGQLLSALERAKELGVLKALGASRGQVARTVLLESGVIGLSGGGLGVGLGALLGPVIVRALQMISGLELPYRAPSDWMVFALVAALAVTLLAGLYPIWRMNHGSAVEAVRTG